MNKYIKDSKTILVWNSVPYSLVREENITAASPCLLCDLSDDCCGDDKPMKFLDLCIPLSGEEGFFFKKDWEAVNKRIVDYLNFNPE